MKIAIFTDSFLPGVGGSENAVLGLATALQKENDVVVCAPYYSKKYKDNFPFKVIRANSLRLTDNDYFGMPAITPKFKKQLDEFKPDVLHCQSVSPMAGFAVKYAKKHHIPLVMTVHTKFRTAFSRSIKSKAIVNMLLRGIGKKLNQADAVYTVSRDIFDEIKSYGYTGKPEVIKNGANFERVKDIEKQKILAIEKYGLKNEENVFLYVGHIVKFKNLQFTIDALKILKQKGLKFKMLFVGHGMDDEYFKKYCIKQGLSDNVIFTGQITDKKLLNSIYSASDLFLFPSIFDNDPLTLVEAALNHVPAITLENTGSSERLENNVSGFIVKNDVNAFAGKILQITKDKANLKKIGDNAEKLIPKNWDDTAKEYVKVFKGLIEKN